MGLEVSLALTFLWGIEGLAVAMLPMRFLDGRKVSNGAARPGRC
jgi:hypothetical protein